MPVYPIHVQRRSYKGAKEAIRRKTMEYNCLVARVEEYLNKRIEASEEEVQVIEYYEIAQEMGLSTDTVCKILFPVDGGDNGITVWKGRNRLTPE